jgi:hypothetical protein
MFKYKTKKKTLADLAAQLTGESLFDAFVLLENEL